MVTIPAVTSATRIITPTPVDTTAKILKSCRFPLSFELGTTALDESGNVVGMFSDSCVDDAGETAVGVDSGVWLS